MKTSIFDMTFVLPPLVEMTEVMKDMPTYTNFTLSQNCCCIQESEESDMKTSIFDMNFVLPPMVEMIEVEKDMPSATLYYHPWFCTVPTG